MQQTSTGHARTVESPLLSRQSHNVLTCGQLPILLCHCIDDAEHVRTPGVALHNAGGPLEVGHNGAGSCPQKAHKEAVLLAHVLMQAAHSLQRLQIPAAPAIQLQYSTITDAQPRCIHDDALPWLDGDLLCLQLNSRHGQALPSVPALQGACAVTGTGVRQLVGLPNS